LRRRAMITITRVQATLFDLDGVLVDSMPLITRLLGRWAGIHGLERGLVLRAALGRREVDLVRELAPWADVDAEVARMQTWQTAEFDGCMPCPGAERLLRSLSGRWAVVTSGSRQVATGRLHAAGLPLPPTLVSSQDVQAGKPHPEPYLRAAAILGLDPSTCVVVEDAPSGIASALGAGMRVIAVTSSHDACLDGLDAAHAHVRSLADIRVLGDIEVPGVGSTGISLAIDSLAPGDQRQIRMRE
jgi:mannitol-1-/sugar-/sorbitol-6-phosphatase